MQLSTVIRYCSSALVLGATTIPAAAQNLSATERKITAAIGAQNAANTTFLKSPEPVSLHFFGCATFRYSPGQLNDTNKNFSQQEKQFPYPPARLGGHRRALTCQ